MKYFGAIYNYFKSYKIIYDYICSQLQIIGEAKEQGLELKLGQFFYNREKGCYNDQFRMRLLADRKEKIEKLDELINKHRSRISKFEIATIVYLYHSLHPRKSIRAKNALVKQ